MKKIFTLILTLALIIGFTSSAQAYSLNEALVDIRDLKTEILNLREKLTMISQNGSSALLAGPSKCTIISFTGSNSDKQVYSIEHTLTWKTSGCSKIAINGISQPLNGSVSAGDDGVIPFNFTAIGQTAYDLVGTDSSGASVTKRVTMNWIAFSGRPSSSVPTPPVAAGTSNALVAAFDITMSNVSTQTLRAVTVSRLCPTQGGLAMPPFKNIRLVVGSTQVGTIQTPSACSSDRNDVIFTVPLVYASNETKTIKMYADIDSAATPGLTFSPGVIAIKSPVQTAGYQYDNWVFKIIAPLSPDACPNIVGYQSVIPAGMVKDSSGNCIITPLDSTPRIGYWYGKVNQHVDAAGNWLTDPDGSSGANIDKLTYCKKWFPNTISVEAYKSETITSWRAARNTGLYTWTVVTDKCVQPIDICPNVSGLQTTIPAGMIKDASGNCVASVGYDPTPRIAYVTGFVNQHVDALGNWSTDPDGKSGTNIDKLTYCKKWFPSTKSVQAYKTETLTTWRGAGNVGLYTRDVVTDRCVQ